MGFNYSLFSSELFPLFAALAVVSLLSLALVVAALVFGNGSVDPEKLSAYECGFNPFEDARSTFEIRFYLVAILFILFDVEVALLIPLISTIFQLTFSAFCFVFFFFWILTLGFFYEWKKGALDWS